MRHISPSDCDVTHAIKRTRSEAVNVMYRTRAEMRWFERKHSIEKVSTLILPARSITNS